MDMAQGNMVNFDLRGHGAWLESIQRALCPFLDCL